jgi:hypothetical protein
MTSILKADTIQDTDGNNIINESGNTITIGASGDTTNIIGTLQNNGSAVGGLSMADQWRVTSAATFTGEVDITANLEQVDTTGQGTLGSAMTESSGIFTFPSTGIYLVSGNIAAYRSGDARYVILYLKGTTNNSSYSTLASGYSSIKQAESSATYANPSTSTLVDVTDTSNVKVKFALQATQECTLSTSSSINRCFFTFLRLGDT